MSILLFPCVVARPTKSTKSAMGAYVRNLMMHCCPFFYLSIARLWLIFSSINMGEQAGGGVHLCVRAVLTQHSSGGVFFTSRVGPVLTLPIEFVLCCVVLCCVLLVVLCSFRVVLCCVVLCCFVLCCVLLFCIAFLLCYVV